MILDKELELVTAVAFDLGTVRPGPGKPIKCIATGVTLNVAITTGPATGAESSLMTVECGGADLVEFELPSNTEQFIVPTFADGAVDIVLEGNQTNR